jgi:hypothetical protein
MRTRPAPEFEPCSMDVQVAAEAMKLEPPPPPVEALYRLL